MAVRAADLTAMTFCQCSRLVLGRVSLFNQVLNSIPYSKK